MADDAAFSSPSGGGIPPWLIVGGVGVGIIVLVLVVTKGSSGGTTAAGASINAGLGSLQEEQMNLLGTVQAGQLANSANFASLGGQLADTQKNILAAITAQGTTTGQQIQGAIDTVNQNTNAGNQSILSSVADALQRLLTGQNNITSTVQSESQAVQVILGGINSQVAGLGNQMTGIGGQISGLGGQITQMNSNILTTQQDIITRLGNVQAGQSQIMATIQPMLTDLINQANQLQNLQASVSQVADSQSAYAQQLWSEIASTQSQISQSQQTLINYINTQSAQNTANFNDIQGNLGSMWQSMLDQFYGVGYAISNVGYHVGANPNPATDPNWPVHL